MLTKCPQRAKRTASRVIENEAVVVIPEEGLVRVLNEVGASIWQLSDGKNTVADIINIISQEFDLSQEQAQEDTLDFIKELEKKQMVVLADVQVNGKDGS